MLQRYYQPAPLVLCCRFISATTVRLQAARTNCCEIIAGKDRSNITTSSALECLPRHRRQCLIMKPVTRSGPPRSASARAGESMIRYNNCCGDWKTAMRVQSGLIDSNGRPPIPARGILYNLQDSGAHQHPPFYQHWHSTSSVLNMVSNCIQRIRMAAVSPRRTPCMFCLPRTWS